MLSKNLKKIRNEKNLTLRVLAEKAGVSKSTLSDIENKNVKSTTIATLEKIADALEVSPSYLIGESLDYILETQLEKLEMTFEDLAEESGLSIEYLERLGNISPGEWDYHKIKLIARILKLNPEYLITALAKQEPPIYDALDRSTPEEDFGTISSEKETIIDSPLSESEIFTLAAQFINYEESLTELDIEKMKIALKVALTQN